MESLRKTALCTAASKGAFHRDKVFSISYY